MEIKEISVSRKELEREARKKDILDTALRLFSQKGYHNVKVDDIAEQVGLSKGTLYLYFENKEKLFFSIIRERADLLFKYLTEAVQCEQSFMKCFEKFIITYFHFFQEHEYFFKLIQTDKSLMSGEEHKKFHEMTLDIYQIYFQILLDLVLRGQKQDVIRKMDPEAVTKMLRGMIDSYISQRLFIGSKNTIEDEAAELMDLFLNGVKA